MGKVTESQGGFILQSDGSMADVLPYSSHELVRNLESSEGVLRVLRVAANVPPETVADMLLRAVQELRGPFGWLAAGPSITAASFSHDTAEINRQVSLEPNDLVATPNNAASQTGPQEINRVSGASSTSFGTIVQRFEGLDTETFDKLQMSSDKVNFLYGFLESLVITLNLSLAGGLFDGTGSSACG